MTYFPNKFGTLSTLNSSTLALVSTATFVGAYEQVYEQNTITVTTIIGAAELVTLTIDFSVDATGTVKTNKSIIINGSNSINSHTFGIISKYVRVSILANQGTAATGAVQVIYNKTYKPQVSGIAEIIFDNSNSILTKSVISGKDVSGVYQNSGVDILNAVITNNTKGIGTRSVVTGRALDGTTYNTVGVNVANAAILDSTMSINTRSVVTGKDVSGNYQTSGIDALNAVITNTTNAVDTRAVTTGRALDGTTYNTVGMNAANAVVLNSTQSMNTRSILTGRALDGTTYNTAGVDLIDTTALNGSLVLDTRAITTGRALDGTTYNNVGMNAANAAVIDSTMSMNVRGITTGRAFDSNVYNTVSINTVTTAIDNTTQSMNTRAIVTGRALDGTTYNNVGMNAANAVVLNSTMSMNTRSILTGRALDGTTYNTVGVDLIDTTTLNGSLVLDTRAILTGRALDGATYNIAGVNPANAVVLNSTQSINTRAITTGLALDGTTYNTVGVNAANAVVLNTTLSANTRSITTGVAIDGTTYNTIGANAANAVVVDGTISLNTRSITTGKDVSGIYQTSGIDALNAVITNATKAVDTRAVITGLALDGTTYNTIGVNVANASILDSTMSMNTRSITTGEGGDGVYRTANVDNIYGVNSMANYITKPLDVYNRVKVSQPTLIFSSTQVNNNDSDQWDTSLTGGATANWVLGFPQTTMQVTTSGDISVRQQHGYNTIYPGASVLVLMSGTMLQATTPTNVRARIGYFDQLSSKTVDTTPTGDGFYFQVANVAGVVTNSVVYRYSNIITIPPVTPVQTEVVIAQTNWNIDKLDGTGISGITVNFARKLTYFISMEQLGSGNVTLGVYYNNIQVPCHQFKFSGDQDNNLNFVASLTRTSLPIRYELQATGTVTGGPATMRQINSSVLVEGPIAKFYQKTFSVTNGLVITSGLRATPVYIPFIAMRLNLSAGTNKTPRVKIQLNSISVCNSGLKDTGLYIFYFKSPGANPVTGGAWLNSSSAIVASQFGGAVILGSAVEYNLSGTATSLTGGLLAYCASFGSTDPTFIVNVENNNLIIQSDIAGNSDYLVLSMCRLGSLTSTYFATISWNEFV
jgi:hypothetical protein